MLRISPRRLKTAVCTAVIAAASMSAAHAATPLYVYKGNGSDGRKQLPAFEKYIGKRVDGVVDFVAYDSWTSFDSDAAWGISGWKGSGYKLAESVPLTVKGTPLADVASGKQDAHYTKLAQLLVSNGFPDAYIRLGWEFNGGWYPWAFAGHERDYSAAFRRVVQLMRAVPGAKFQFVWNPNLGMGQQWPDVSYPGDDVIDVIATDVYDQSWVTGYTDQGRRWNDIANTTWGLQALVAFAKKHNKPYAFPEWGVGTRSDGHGGGDDPTFVHNMAPYIAKAAFSGYWDFPAADFNGLISNNQYPNAGKQFVADYGSPATAQIPTAPASSSTSTNASTTQTSSTTTSTTPTSTTPTSTTSVSTTPATTTPSNAAPAIAKPIVATISNGGSVKVTNNPDGSAWLDLSLPYQKAATTYTIKISAWRQLGWSATNIWYSNQSFTWKVDAGKSGSGRVYVGAK